MASPGGRGKFITICIVLVCLMVLAGYNRDRFLTWDRVDLIPAIPIVAEHNSSFVEIVVASLKSEDTSWVQKYLKQWKQSIYVVDDAAAPLTVPQNKGHESMVYLTYIIDNYDNLPDNILFIHASRFAWHNDDPDYDAVRALRNFRFSYLQETGYVNLRCVWLIGCPAEIYPYYDEANVVEGPPETRAIYKQSFQELLPQLPVPEVVAVSCCAQFGVTRGTIRRRPKEDYVRFRQWLLDTPLEDARSGRVMEFTWHIIFGMEAVHCPSAQDCYCNVYGLCNLNCSAYACEGRYTLPPYSILPEGWPRVGWYGEDREFPGPLH